MTMSEKIRLDGRRALVCGASQGIGCAAARVLAGQGASVTLLARSAEKLAMALAELPAEAGQQHAIVVADLGDTRAPGWRCVREAVAPALSTTSW